MQLDSLVDKASQYKEQIIAVAGAEDIEVLEAVMVAIMRGLGRFLLFGKKGK